MGWNLHLIKQLTPAQEVGNEYHKSRLQLISFRY